MPSSSEELSSSAVSTSPSSALTFIWEFPKIGVPHFGVLIIGSYYLGYYIRVPYFRKLPYRVQSFPVLMIFNVDGYTVNKKKYPVSRLKTCCCGQVRDGFRGSQDASGAALGRSRSLPIDLANSSRKCSAAMMWCFRNTIPCNDGPGLVTHVSMQMRL